jgi:hypothetical protein
MALSASKVYHLTVDKLRDVCLERGLNNSGPVRSLWQRLADHLNSSLMKVSRKVDMAQASILTDLEHNVEEFAPPGFGCGSHGGGGDSPTLVLVESLHQISPLSLEELEASCVCLLG